MLSKSVNGWMNKQDVFTLFISCTLCTESLLISIKTEPVKTKILYLQENYIRSLIFISSCHLLLYCRGRNTGQRNAKLQ